MTQSNVIHLPEANTPPKPKRRLLRRVLRVLLWVHLAPALLILILGVLP